MTFERFIARRYLFSGRHKALVSVITMISIAGVSIGVFALVVVIAVMEGFTTNLIDKIIGAYAHMDIRSMNAEAPYVEVDSVMAQVSDIPGVKAAAPVIMGQALAVVLDPNGPPRQAGLFIQGVDVPLEQKVTSLTDNVVGTKDPATTGIVMSKVMIRDQLQVQMGQRLRLLSPTSAETPEGRAYVQRNVVLTGIFETGFPETDQMFAYMSLEGARSLFVIPDGAATGIHLVVDDVGKVEDVKKRIQKALGPYFHVTSWQDRNPVLFDMLRLEKWAMFIILLLIVLVAAFNIIGTLVMVVTEKTREIGILKSMGATERSIMRVFLVQGMIIGVIGTALGASFGLLTCYLLQHHIKLPVNTAAYLSDRIPVLVNPWMDVLIVVSSLAICLVASVYPARAAAKLDPVEALRYE